MKYWKYNTDKETIMFIICMVLLTIALFHNLGILPLYLEEPRRAMIAMEMLINKNIFVPTQFGHIYTSKPPLWNWLIISAYKIFGNYSEFSVRFFSVISFLSSGILLFFIGKRHVNKRFGMLSCLLFLVSADILFYFSLLGEIDLFFSFLIISSFLVLYHFFAINRKAIAFLLFYFIISLAFLTKGIPAIAFAFFTLLVIGISNKQFKSLFSIWNILGIVVFLSIVGIYYYYYSKYYPSDFGSKSFTSKFYPVLKFIKGLYSESEGRTIVGVMVRNMVAHILLFPLEIIKNIFPSTLLLLLLFRKHWYKTLSKNKYVKYCLYIFIANILIYWLSPGTRQRYIYMLYPMFINVLIYLYLNDNKKKAINILYQSLFALSIVLFIGMNFIPRFSHIKNLFWISLVMIIITVILGFMYNKYKSFGLYYVILLFILMRFAFNILVIPMKLEDNLAVDMKNHALKINELTGDRKVELYQRTLISRTTAYYIITKKHKIVNYTDTLVSGNYYIMHETEHPIKDKSYDILYEFDNDGEHGLKLVQLK